MREVLDKDRPVSRVCREFGIARKTFYSWLGRYKAASPKLKKRIFESPKRASKREKFASQILKIVSSSPSFGPARIAKELERRGRKLSVRSIWLFLRSSDLETQEKRKEFAQRFRKLRKASDPILPGYLRLSPEARKRMVEEVVISGKSVSDVCQSFNLSRKTFYKWKKRYKEAQELEKNLLEALSDQHPTAWNHPRGASREAVKTVLELVIKEPDLSSHKIAQLLKFIGNHGVQRILERENLSHYELRLAYAQAQRIAPKPVFTRLLDRVRLVWETFVPSVAPAPPPFGAGQAPQRMYRMVRPFLLSLVTSSVFSLGFIWWINLLGSQPFATSIGLIFATVALMFGSFFFAYSMKYYFTLAIVLSFSQQEAINNLSAGGQTANSNGKNGRRNGGMLGWILGLGNGSSSLSRGSPPAGGRRGGLEPSLEHITLKRKPFISIHIPFYNEKNVAERMLAAVTAFDWANYEVIVVDDSTDETTEIAKRFLRDNYGSLRIIKVNEGEIFKTSSIPNKPSFTLIHRTTRSGFKGGALREALRVSDPKAEFIVIFDADFVPYPDTLELFLKYFQVTAGTLDFRKVSQVARVSQVPQALKGDSRDTLDTRGTSNIAAVQGYQWHVLNKSENWITRGVRSEYSGSYVIERSGQEILGALKMISGSVYMIRRDVLDEIGWETSITEDFELTLKLYEAGYKVVYTPYIQAPAECVSTLKRLVRQRMRWAEGHSHNIRKMFTRLLFGHWETGDVVNNQIPNPKSQINSNIKIQNSKWRPSPLTLMEKLEFLYLSPYYLQAFFFLVGTISWLISETVFAARLPFWTSLWGWSLVLTNLLALPLLNGVGLFLEEAEERDFVGLLSFIALSYIVVPFQAYAAVKGFLEKEEGPWFRTPKTGHITDIITRGRFFRFLAGILPGRTAPAVSPMEANPLTSSGQVLRMEANELMDNSLIRSNSFSISSYSRYVALATANSRFDSFHIKPKGYRFIGNLVLIFALISALTLSYLGANIKKGSLADLPVQTRVEKVGRDSSFLTSLFGVIAGPETKNLAKEVDGQKQEAQKDNGQKEPRTNELASRIWGSVKGKGSQVLSFASGAKRLLVSNHGEVKKEVKNEGKAFKKDFRSNEEPELTLQFPIELEQKNLLHRLFNLFKVLKVQASFNDEIKARLFDNSGEEIATDLEVSKKSEGNIKVKVPTFSSFKPGAYKLKVELAREGETFTQEQDFTWGVLAINTNKSIYLPGEQAYLQMAALKDDGHTLCDADLELKVQNEKLKAQRSGKCAGDSVTDTPDYFAYYQVGSPGTYEMVLTNLDNGYSITDSFEVRESTPFDIERTGPTRIYPPAVYEMKLKIKTNVDFKGEVIETIPESFDIKNKDQKSKTVSWNVAWKAGETYELSYQFDAPDISPYLYLLGPLKLFSVNPRNNPRGSAVFAEQRQWQIAADAEVTIDATTNTTLNSHAANPALVFTWDQTGYMFYRDSGGACGYSKTTDGGTSWGVFVGTTAQTDCLRIAVWYDRWTPADTGTVIHIAFMESGTDDYFYDTLDTNGDSQGTEVAIDTTGVTIAAADQVTITKSTTGVFYIGIGDASNAGVSKVRRCSTTCSNGANWSNAGTSPLDQTNDYLRLVPLASGNVMIIKDDISAENILSRVWNGTDWGAGWTTINAAAAADSTTYLETIAATVDRSNNDIYLAYGASVAGAGTADIRTAVYNGSSWTSKTDVITDASTVTNLDIAINENNKDIYVGYLRGTLTTAMNAYYKVSTNGMTSWGGETQFNTTDTDLRWMHLNGMSNERIYGVYEQNATNDGLFGNTIADLEQLSSNQAAYRWFENNNGTSVVSALGNQDTVATAPAQGTGFRLRGLLDIGNANLAATGQSFRFQSAVKSGTCDSDFVGETYSDVSDTSGNIRFNNNSTPADGDTVTENATLDPTYLGHTKVMERYEENNPTNNVAQIPSGQAGLWDFSLVDFSAPAATDYCFRVKKDSSYAVNPKKVKTVSGLGGGGNLNYGTWDGTSYWIGNFGDFTLYKISPAGTILNTYILAADIRPLELAWDGTYIWVASADTYGKLVKFDPATGQTVATYTKNPTGLGAGGVQGVMWDGTNIWIGVAQQGGGAGSGLVKKLNPSDGSDICEATGITDVNGLTHSGSYVWAAANTGGNFMAKIAKSDCSKTTYAMGSNPVRMDNDGTYVYVAHWNGGGIGKVYKILMSDGSTTATYNTCVAANTIRLDSDNTHFWTACDDGRVTVHNTSDGAVVGDLIPGTAGNNMNGLIFDGSYMWVNNWEISTVYKMNTGQMLDTYTKIPQITTAPPPSAPTLYPDDGGATQIAFNNTRQNSTTPRFRASATHTANFNRFQLELNTASNFSGTAYTQTFSGTFVSGTQYNLLADGLSPSLPTTNGVTYYVRARASADGGSNYGGWSSGTWSYTYKNTGDPDWFQTTDAQFVTGTLTDTETSGSGSVRLVAGGANWYNANWDYRKKITIDNTKVSGSTDLSSFPVLISRTDTAWKDTGNGGKVTQSDGGDIVFTASNGTTKLDHEIEKYVNTSGELIAWVRVLTLGATADTDIYIYYGGPSTPDQWNPTGVWDINYVMAQHLKESSGAGNFLLDSTSKDNDGAPLGTTPTYISDAKMDGGYSFAGNNQQRVEIPDSATLQPTSALTASAWARVDAMTGTDHNPILWKGQRIGWGAVFLFRIAVNSSSQLAWGVTCGTTEGWFNTSMPVAFGDWGYYTITFDGTTTRAYVNGAELGSNTACSGATLNGMSTYPVRSGFGYRSSDTEETHLNGAVDELRMSNVVRPASADWIQTEYNNQNSPSTFYGVGTEEQGATSSGTVMSPEIDFDWVISQTGWGTAAFSTTETNGDVKLRLYYTATTACDTIVPNVALSGNSTGFDVAASPIDISGLSTTTYNRICLQAALTDVGGTPYLNDWTVTWGVSPTFNQSAYRWFENNTANSTDVGPAMATQDNPATLSSDAQEFRLRLLIHVSAAQLALNGQNFKIQIASKVGASCDTNMATTDESYSDLLPSSGTIRYFDDTDTAKTDGANLTANVNDPVHAPAHNTVEQDYEEANNFTNTVAAVPSGEDGEWDFSIVDFSAADNTTYCLRVVKSDATVLATYTVIPEFTTVPENPLLLFGLYPLLAGILKRLRRRTSERKTNL